MLDAVASRSELPITLPAVIRQAACALASRVRDDLGVRVESIRLFGSYARAAAHEDSDVDVCIVIRDVTWGERAAILNHAADLALAHDIDLSPTVLDATTYELWRHQDRPLVRDIARDGIPL